MNLNGQTGLLREIDPKWVFSPKKMLTRLCYIDFDGSEFLKAPINGKILDNKIIEKYAPNVVKGVEKLSNWAKNL